ncbi:MAG TPA: phosphatase PAP2 family protein [Ktedonobacteraceae bacterium]|nr:phosphatase PAP2 family protein [Ktedonobacteraceae bacterium]
MDLLQFNYMLFQDVNGHAGQNPLLDILMIFCANWLIFLWPLLLLLAWGRPLNWRKRPLRPGEAEMIQRIRSAVLWIAVACLLAYIFNLAIEQFIFEPRPFISHKVHLLVTHAADASFPSDHTAWSFAVLGMLLFTFLPVFFAAWRERAWGWQDSKFATIVEPLLLLIGALIIACIIGLARVFVGVHYPGDILGGAFDGLLAAFLVTLLRLRLQQLTNAVLQFAHKLRVA